MKNYKLIEHTADLGMEVWGKNMRELLQNAGLAFFDIIIGLKNITPRFEEKIIVSGNSFDNLFYSWLNELLFRFDAERKIFNFFTAEKISSKKLIISGSYEFIDEKKHSVIHGIKAITLHMLRVWKKGGKLYGRVIFDV